MDQTSIHPNTGPDKSPVVAIHGSASGGSLWGPLANLLNHERTVVAPYLKGYGRSDKKTLDLKSTLKRRAEPIVREINEMDHAVHLVAHSFGASVAFAVVKEIPEKVKSVTCYEPVIPTLLRDSVNPEDAVLLADLLALSEVVRGTGSKVGMETFINFWSEPNAWQKLSASIQDRFSELAPIVYQDFVEAYHNAGAESVTEFAYQGPLKILIGEHTNIHAKRMAEILSQRYSQATIEILSDMDHMGPLSRPASVNAIIIEHVQQVEKSPSRATYR